MRTSNCSLPRLGGTLVVLAAAALASCDGISPVEPLTPEAPDQDLVAETATLTVEVLYDGAPIGTSGFRAPCFWVQVTSTSTVTRHFCTPTITIEGLAPGDNTIQLMFSSLSTAAIPATTVTLSTGANTHTIELADHVGILTGHVTVDGAPGSSGGVRGLRSTNQFEDFYRFSSPFLGDYRLFASAGSGEVRYQSITGTALGSAQYTVEAGQTTVVETMEIELASLTVQVRYHGEPIDISEFRHPSLRLRLSGASFLVHSFNTSSTTAGALAPGDHSIWLELGNGAVAVPAAPITLEPGTNTYNFELADYVGILTGHVTVDGEPASSGFIRNVRPVNQFQDFYHFFGTFVGDFRLFAVAGSGEVWYHSPTGGVLASAGYTAEAGESVDIGTIEAQLASLEVHVVYQGEPIDVSDYRHPAFWLRMAGPSSLIRHFSGPTFALTGLAPGDHTIWLDFASLSSTAVPAVPITLEPGANTYTFELADHVGIVTGSVTVDGAPATGGSVRGVNPANRHEDMYAFTTFLVGRFRLFQTPQCGEARYHSVSGVLLASGEFCVEAGETSVIGTLQQHQSIVFPAIEDRTFGDPPFDVTVSATSGLPVTLAADGACAVAGTTVTLTGVGSCSLTASQDGDDDFHPAPPVTRAFAVIEPPVPLDDTPPVITVHVSGTLGENGWYTSDVGITWSVDDDESPVSALDGCGPVSVTEDTGDATFTCTATSDGGTAELGVTVERDATAPTLAFDGNLGAYTVDAVLAITCSATDAMSGLASSDCPGAQGPAYLFDLGTNTLTAHASDNAGLASTLSTTFTVEVTTESLCALTRRWVAHHGIARSMCVKLDAAARSEARGNRASEAGQIGAYINEVEAQAGKALTDEHAAILIRLAGAL